MATLKRRVEELERLQLSPGPRFTREFDDDALAIYLSEAYLDATMQPSYHDIESTALYDRGKALRDKLYGPIIPVHIDDHIKRYTRASGEFELAFGREPRQGDMLHCSHVAMMHSPANLSIHFARLIGAWQRQLPHLTCPLRFEDGRLFRRLRPTKRGEEAKWEEDAGVTWAERWWLMVDRWCMIPEGSKDRSATDGDPVYGVVFLGVLGAKHQCRPATPDQLQQMCSEPAIKKPTDFMFANQTFCDFLVDVMGA